MEIDADALLLWKHKAKTHMRKNARAVRGAMSSSAISARSAAIVARLAELPAIEAARDIALFYPMDGKNEVDLRRLDAMLRAHGKRIAYPAMEARPDETITADAPPAPPEMVFRFVDDLERMDEHGFGFREPSPTDALATRLDVIVVPALAVATSGHRIGYGAGYFDRTLPRFASAMKVVVAFDFQLVAEVPSSENDVHAIGSSPIFEPLPPAARPAKGARVPLCRECDNEAEELFMVKVEGKKKKMCDDCRSRAAEGQAIAEASEAVVQGMMGFKGRR